MWLNSALQKIFQQKNFNEEEECENKSAIINKPSGFLPKYLATSIQSQNTRSATYMNHNNNNI